MKHTESVSGLVSIIIPIYNSEKYIHTCIDSILSQSYRNIEILLIDGCSTDNSGKICDEYALKDKRIKAVHKKDSGPAEARNTGISNSCGEFILFIDADDYLETDALKRLIEEYAKHKADITIGDFRKIKNTAIENRKDISFPNNKMLTKPDLVEYSRLYLKKPNKYLLFAFSWGRLFKSSIIKNDNILFDTDLHTFEDVAFNFDCLRHTNKVYFLKEPIYNHTIHGNYLSATMSVGGNLNNLFGYETALTNIGKYLKNSISDAEIEKEIGHAYIFLTIIQLVRMCGQIKKDNEKKITSLIGELINDPHLQENLKHYSPEKGDSKILPFLMRLKLVRPIMAVCKYKARKRYQK